jgi:hypothetical protein
MQACGTKLLTSALRSAYSRGERIMQRQNADQIDARLAKYFAWAFASPRMAFDIAERLRAAEGRREEGSAPLSPGRSDPCASEKGDRRAIEACRPVALAIAQTWTMPPSDAFERSVRRLVGRADRLGFDLIALGEWPAEAVRLLRMILRCTPAMTARQRDAALRVARVVPLHHRETADFLVEIALAGDRAMCEAIFSEDDWVPELADPAALIARLADVVDDGPSYACRAVAIELILRFEQRAPATPALRRALHLPNFAVRAGAFYALATARPSAVTSDDLVFVLRDLVAHAPPDSVADGAEEHERRFADAVIESLAHVQPEEAAEALLDWIDAECDALWLDAGWATEALAVAFPEAAAAMVDYWLSCSHTYQRTWALAAIERLPEAIALPRLEAAANDPAPCVRDAARQQWLDRCGRARPGCGSELVGAALLDAPPSDRFQASLAVLQGRVAAARQAMGRALLAQAPSRETLVLLLQLVGDDAESSEPLPSHKEGGLAAALVDRFGLLGIEGLCALAKRFPEPESFGWTRRLGDLVERGTVPRDAFGLLRDLAARHVSSENAVEVEDSLRLLALVGPPPELLGRILAIGLRDGPGGQAARQLVVEFRSDHAPAEPETWRHRSDHAPAEPETCRHRSDHAPAEPETWRHRSDHVPAEPETCRRLDRPIDARLASEMALALADRDWERLQNASSMALDRGAPAACVIAQCVLEVAEHDEEAVDAAVVCARGLQSLGQLADTWTLAALARPESTLFTVAARAWRKSSSARVALEAALSSSARAGSSAVEAAIALLNADPPLGPSDHRLRTILADVSPPHRAELIVAMCVRGAPLSLVARHLESLFASSDPRVTSTMMGIAAWLKSSRGRSLLRRVLPRVVDSDLRADIEEELGEVVAPFWDEG